MTVVTLSRGTTSVDIELDAEAGEQLLSTSFGKPDVNIRENGGTINPRVNDRWSGLENYTLVGKLYDYQTAHDLADLVKTGSTTPLELEIPHPAYADSVTVAPAAGQDGALSLSFPAGRRDFVDVNLSLTRVGDVLGIGAQHPAVTPTADGEGNGPVQIQIGSQIIELPTAGLSLERSVGRPNDVVRRVPSDPDPNYIVKAKVTSDVFTFSFETVSDIPETLNSLTDAVFRNQLGRGGVTVKFNGLLGLGDIKAIPVGSSPFRQVHQAGRGWVTNPVLEFRRVFDPFFLANQLEK